MYIMKKRGPLFFSFKGGRSLKWKALVLELVLERAGIAVVIRLIWFEIHAGANWERCHDQEA